MFKKAYGAKLKFKSPSEVAFSDDGAILEKWPG